MAARASSRSRLSFCARYLATVSGSTGPPRTTAINVGQGESTLLHAGDFAVLVDGGKPAAGPTFIAYLRQEAVRDVDVIVATHVGSGGAPE